LTEQDETKKRRPSATDLAIRNDILRALLSSEYRHLLPKLEQVDLRFGDVVYRTDQRIDHVYFPETAVVAMIDTLEDGGTVEVGIIGHEGWWASMYFWARWSRRTRRLCKYRQCIENEDE
jgi:hypothetical protein